MAVGGETMDARNVGGAAAIKQEERPRPLVGADGLAEGGADIDRCLERFAEAAASNPTNPPRIPAELDCVLREISSVGVPFYGWGGLKELMAAKMVEEVGSLEKDTGFVRANGGKDYPQRRDELVASLRSFDAAPFTLQRLAEVLQDPRRQYSSTHKLINGLERLLAVSSTLPTRSRKAALRKVSSAPPASSSSFVALHDARMGKSNGSTRVSGACGTAPAAAAAVVSATGSGAPSQGGASTAASVAVKVEELSSSLSSMSGSVGSGDAALVPEENEAIVEEGSGEWEVEEASGGRGQGPGRKRLKVELKSEPPVMSE